MDVGVAKIKTSQLKVNRIISLFVSLFSFLIQGLVHQFYKVKQLDVFRCLLSPPYDDGDEYTFICAENNKSNMYVPIQCTDYDE